MVLAAKGKDVLEIRKVFAVHPRAEESQAGEGLGYVLDVNLSARSLDGSAHKVSFEMLGPVGVPHETKAPDDRKVVWGERSERYRDTRRVLKTWDELVAALGDKSKPFPGIADKPEPASLVWYAGAMNRFFAALVLPDRLTGEANGAAVPPSEWQAVEIRHLPTPRDYEPDEKPGHDFATVFRIAADVPASGKVAKASAGAGEGWSRGYHVYLGPKRKELLEAVQTRYAADFALPKIIDYAQFSCFCDALGCGDYIGKFIGYPLLRLLDIIHYIIPNYGVAIIVMVIIVRAVLYPISRKSAMSMLRMKELQPKLAEIQAKYADNREELGRKQMELYQKEGINPVGGCLPMLLQMPIWIGLWGALSAAVDLRHAPFMLWMRDLAGQDSLVHFAHAPSLALPLCGQVSLPLSLNVLPLVMAIFMFIQSKQMTAQQPTNPDAPDPRIMTYMTTGLFVWMLYTAPAGLNLYIMTSTIFGLLEQKWVKDHYEELKAKGLLAPKEGGKPGFFARLIEKVREIQEQQETEGTGGGKSGGANLSKGDGNSGSGGSGEGGGGGGGGRRKKRKK
jgi:YidC/Oxa1 family membrane protein insertase